MKEFFKDLKDFVLSSTPIADLLKPGQNTTAIVRDGYRPVTVDLRGPARRHDIADVGGFCAYAIRHGKPDESTVFIGSDRFVLVISDTVGPDAGVDRDLISYEPTPSDELKDWKKAFAQGAFSHLKFRDFLEERGAVVDREILAAVKGFTAMNAVEYAPGDQNGDSITVRTTRKTGSSTTNGEAAIPREFKIAIPMLIGWEKKYEIRIRVEAELSGTAVNFRIGAIDLGAVNDALMKDLLAHVTETLGAGWLVVRGGPRVSTPAPVSAPQPR